MRPSVCACPRGRPLRHRRAFGSRLSPRVCASVGGCHRRPSAPQGLRVSARRDGGRGGAEVAAPGGGEWRGRRQWAGARCGPEGCVRGAGGGCQSRLSLAGEQRPPQVSLPPRSGPPPRGPGPAGHGACPEGSRPPNRTPGDAPHPPPALSLHAPLAAEDVRLPVREPAPRRAGRRRSSRFPVGTPERPGPR